MATSTSVTSTNKPSGITTTKNVSIGGALGVVAVWLIGFTGVTVPATVAVAITALLTGLWQHFASADNRK